MLRSMPRTTSSSWSATALPVSDVVERILGLNDPVDAHVQAYNERDLDWFVACFSPDCVIEDARGTLVARGHAALRTRFGRIFDENPDLHCEIIHRARVGEYVVDEEHITGRYGGEQHGVVISHVRGGVIDHQRFIH